MTQASSQDPAPLMPEGADPCAVTRLLDAAARGERAAADQLLPLVYDELRKLAAARLAKEPSGQTLQATALVHEAYLRLVGNDPDRPFDGRGHFFAAAAEAMRRILVDRARDRRRQKRGGGHRRVRIDLEAILDRAARRRPARPRRGPQVPGPGGSGWGRTGRAARLRRSDARRGGGGSRNRPPHGRPLLGLCPSLALRCPERRSRPDSVRFQEKSDAAWRSRAEKRSIDVTGSSANAARRR